MKTLEEVLKDSKEKLGLKIPCSIEILSPVHIGSGIKLTEGIDFINTGQSVEIISQADLMSYFEENPDELNKFIACNYDIRQLSKSPGSRKYNLEIRKSKEIFEFLRNGFGKPYIPGSSIKGSIRTIILKKIFDNLTENEKNKLLQKTCELNKKSEFASQPILEDIFGKDQQYNLMRTLEIFDFYFEPEDVDLSKVLVLSFTNESGTSYGWKQMGRPSRNVSNIKEATSIFVESLLVGAKSYGSISLNKFLMENKEAKEKLNFDNPFLKNIESLIKAINDYSLDKLNSEKNFFEKLNSKMTLSSLIANIDSIIEKIKKLQKNEFILRLSWRSGWKSMTGDFIRELKKDEKEKWIEYFREKYCNQNKMKMGRPGFSIFPKTRKIVFEDEQPSYLTGWIKVKLYETKPIELKNNLTEEKQTSNKKKRIERNRFVNFKGQIQSY